MGFKNDVSLGVVVRRLCPGDEPLAGQLFWLLAGIFDEARERLPADDLRRLLRRDDFWAVAAIGEGGLLGGLTAHTLPMTRTSGSEVFIYDVAVAEEHRRKGIGRALLACLRELAAEKGIGVVFVGADLEDSEALAFYRGLGGMETGTVTFTFESRSQQLAEENGDPSF